MAVRLDKHSAGAFTAINQSTTDDDGRCHAIWPTGVALEPGLYKVTFDTAAYFASQNVPSFYPFVEITFEVKDTSQHYHIPLLLSPYAFTTYRGS